MPQSKDTSQIFMILGGLFLIVLSLALGVFAFQYFQQAQKIYPLSANYTLRGNVQTEITYNENSHQGIASFYLESKQDADGRLRPKAELTDIQSFEINQQTVELLFNEETDSLSWSLIIPVQIDPNSINAKLTFIDGSQLTLSSTFTYTIPVNRDPHRVLFNPLRNELLVVSWGLNKITGINLTTGETNRINYRGDEKRAFTDLVIGDQHLISFSRMDTSMDKYPSFFIDKYKLTDYQNVDSAVQVIDQNDAYEFYPPRVLDSNQQTAYIMDRPDPLSITAMDVSSAQTKTLHSSASQDLTGLEKQAALIFDPIENAILVVDKHQNLLWLQPHGDQLKLIQKQAMNLPDPNILNELEVLLHGINQEVLYLASGYVIYRYDLKTDELETLTEDFQAIRDMALDSKNNRLFVATLFEGIFEFDLDTGKPQKIYQKVEL